MSYSFDGVNDRMTGTFSSTYGDPITLAAWIKFTDHPISTDGILSVGNSNSSINDSYQLALGNSDNTLWARATDSAGVSNFASATKTGVDATWVPVIAVFAGDSSRDAYFSDATDASTTTRVVADAIQYIQVGELLSGGQDYTGLIAEIAVWNKALDSSERSSYIAGTVASSIAAANLIGYWPLSASNATQSNEGVDAGGDLTVANAVFDSDHPTITGALDPIRLKWRM